MIDPNWELVTSADGVVAVCASAALSVCFTTENGTPCFVVGPDAQGDPEYGVVPLAVVVALLHAGGYRLEKTK